MRNANLLLAASTLVVACAVGSSLPTDDAGSDASIGNDGAPLADATKSDSSTCAAPLVHCSGTDAGICTDLKTNVDHCGTCGTVCGTADASALPVGNGNPDSGIPPIDGGDASTGPFWSTGNPGCDGGACAVDCPSGMTECADGICYDTQEFHEHCGTCATACASTDYCAGGHCCGPGTAWCGSSCNDVLSDDNNCGACGHVCGSGLSCASGTCGASFTVEVFPGSGTLNDPGAASVWSARYYTMTFAASQTITGLSWRLNLATTDSFYAEIWDPGTNVSLAKGTAVSGAGSAQFYNSPINYTFQANKPYLVGAYLSNANTVFPRKDSPSYPFTVIDTAGNINVTACWSTSSSNTDIFPTSTNIWAPDFKLSIQ